MKVKGEPARHSINIMYSHCTNNQWTSDGPMDDRGTDRETDRLVDEATYKELVATKNSWAHEIMQGSWRGSEDAFMDQKQVQESSGKGV